nr:hypothetical protein [Citrobacter freundii]
MTSREKFEQAIKSRFGDLIDYRVGVNMLKDMQDECRQSGRVWVDDAGLGSRTPLYAAPQLPQPAVLSVSEGVLKSLLPDVEKSEFWFEHNGKIFFEGVRFNNAVFEACRAAMLQGKSDGTLTNEGTIPSTQFKPVADLYGITSPTGSETSFTFDAVEARDFIDGGWTCQEYVELERFQDAMTNHSGDANEKVNSPVTPDGWQLVPKEPTEAMNKAGWAAINEHDAINPTYRAMLAAAPQQDVRLALEIGMSRYAGAMQKLVDSGD